MKRIIIGTAGHIDHGKTSLVKALTGVDADRLKEEKERGITIDIGFADLTVGDVHFGFVDVPGHERFVKNMLAGVHGIDLVMLVVAADEGVMPQTREHLEIMTLLGISKGCVALTKIDRATPERRIEVEARIQETLNVPPHMVIRHAGLTDDTPMPDIADGERKLERWKIERERLGAVDVGRVGGIGGSVAEGGGADTRGRAPFVQGLPHVDDVVAAAALVLGSGMSADGFAR